MVSDNRGVRSVLAVALLMAGTLTAAANVWGVRHINSRMLRHVGPQASELLGREVGPIPAATRLAFTCSKHHFKPTHSM